MKQCPTESDDLISIIIPVYKAESYLSKCLDSICGQTYPNLEIICVNDSSPDNSLNILHDYSKRDSRIYVIDKENEGVSSARNAGLAAASGEYIMFVDADDWIDLDICQIAVDAVKKYHADVVLWSYVSENKESQSFKTLFSGDKEFSEDECRQLLHRRFVGICGEELAHPELADSLCPVWGKLYKREVMQRSGARFVDLSEIGTYEDGLFNLEVFGEVKKAVYLDKCFYHYRRDNTGSATSGYNQYLFDRWQNLYQRMAEYITANNLPLIYEEALQNRRALGILGLGLNVLNADVSATRKIKMIKEIITQPKYRQAYSNLCMRYFPPHWKLFYYSAAKGCAVSVFVLISIIRKIIYG